MRDFIYQNFEHCLCGALLIAKLGDNISTWLATPNLKLEGNPIARKLRWGFIWFTLVLCLLPYFSTALAVMALPVFLMVSASNFGRVWMARALGEDEVGRLMKSIARRSTLGAALWPTLVSAAFVAALGAIVLFFYPFPDEDWGFWLGLGILIYAAVLVFYGTLAWVRLFRRVRSEPA
jgi:hypothetical protein